MGEVFLAEQLRPIRRTVALKFIRAGAPHSDLAARFEREMQIMATMDHPHIATVFEAGRTSTGRRFLAMEYVPGMSVTQYCDRRRLDLSARLRLFGQVCSALEHVHQRGVIHRDVKPPNVLVLERGGTPVVKLIDFGIARGVDEALRDPAGATETGMLLGTPRYMSPEQLGVLAADVDARADVYSLGVLLHEILVGRPPGPAPEGRDGHANLIAHLRWLKSDPVTAPSTMIGSRDERSRRVAARRGTDPASLRARLRGDLDAIVARALRFDVTQRYQTAAEIGDDVARHLSRRPIAARSHSFAHRAFKSLSRHRRTAASVLLCVSALVIGSVRAAMADAEMRRHRRRAELVRICDDVRRHVALAHLWFEEALAGDRSIDLERDVFGNLEHARDLTDLALDGGAPDMLTSVPGDLSRLETMADRRWELRADVGRAGALLDVGHDALFVRVDRACADARDGLLRGTRVSDPAQRRGAKPASP